MLATHKLFSVSLNLLSHIENI